MSLYYLENLAEPVQRYRTRTEHTNRLVDMIERAGSKGALAGMLTELKAVTCPTSSEDDSISQVSTS